MIKEFTFSQVLLMKTDVLLSLVIHILFFQVKVYTMYWNIFFKKTHAVSLLT